MHEGEAIRRAILTVRRQGNVATRDDLLRLGIHSGQLTRIVRMGSLVRLFPGILTLSGTQDDPLVRLRGALLAVGGDVVASHASAGWVQGLLDRPPAIIHVAAVGSHRRRIPGVSVHRVSGALPSLSYRGVRCTTPARTLLDLAAISTSAQINLYVDRALEAGLVRVCDLAQDRGRRGRAALERSLRELGHLGAPGASVLESEMHRLVNRYRLPVPKIQVETGPNGRYRVDCRYEEERLTVELYGYTWHHSPEQMQHDLERQRQLTLQGETVLIFTWADVTRQPERLAREIRAALRR